MANKQPTQAEVTHWLQQTIEDGLDRLIESVENLREGDYYSDPAPDSLADIAKSLRIISGREKLD